jgi:AcrR family transcriptional regulator
VSTLRETKTRRLKQAILAAAAHEFSRHGYAATNVEDIAARAGVGVSTIYKHFGVKGGLVRELWRPEIERMRQEGERLLADPPAEPARALADLVGLYRFGDDWKQRDLFRAVAGHDLGYGALFEGLRERLDALILAQLERLIRHFQRLGRVPGELNGRDMAFVLYSVMTLHLQMWAMQDAVPLDRTRRDLRRRILLLFRPWVT